ncbi:hypothetical protein EVAR_57735_1 [Eumeta japonica]|uniref:Mariner Mos1 transposase n=1 Tax=Eumeta variegata TaxID=151549 RepID=A0A4C1Y545_EUMVA|nr:hypothetical protein EVAR_57735_1 [Eumeta japonica]
MEEITTTIGSQRGSSVIVAQPMAQSFMWKEEFKDKSEYYGTTGEYYATSIEKLRVVFKSKRRGKLTKGVLLLHDEASVHTSYVAGAAGHRCRFK